jgi:hypothetical protein
MTADEPPDITAALRDLAAAWSQHWHAPVPWDRVQIIAATYTHGVTIDFIVSGEN